MRAFLALLITGILLSIVGLSGEGLLWLSVLGMLTVLGAAAYAALSSRPRERQRDEPVQRRPQHEPWRRRRTATLTCQAPRPRRTSTAVTTAAQVPLVSSGRFPRHPRPIPRQQTRPRQHAMREPAMAGVAVQAQRLPGVGWRYSLPADQGRQLMIVVEDRGLRHLVVLDRSLDEPLMTVRLSDTLANVAAALLTGARFHIEVAEAETPSRAPEEAVVRPAGRERFPGRPLFRSGSTAGAGHDPSLGSVV
jgi:hypothetical protein